MAKTQKFKAEVQQLLNLMIHSLYSNRDIFLRELVANAADAIDKARFESLTDSSVAQDWQIRLAIDAEKKTVTISDNGVGMTMDEVIENIGTIAQSGTKAFMEALEAKKDSQAELPELIGQFGVGFYSAFMVADKIELETKRAGSTLPAVRWSSTGTDTFEVDECGRAEQGTTITLFLKEDAAAYLNDWKLSEIVRRYSDFIEYPIILPTKTVQEDKSEVVEDKVLNSKKAIWLRKAADITADEHQSFFGHLSHGGKYLKSIQIAAEGSSDFKALLYLPDKLPFNFFFPEHQKKGLQLYVKRVFITDDCKELIPDYLRFLRGVVDSNDLPLNVSREILQENPHLAKIQKTLTTKVLGELKKMAENEAEAYQGFFREFGKILKEGIHMDYANQEKIKDLALYESMNTPDGKMISLREYVTAMPEGQKDIYYITGEKRAAVESSPALEIFRAKGFDVLFMTDPIDEWVMQSMFQYDQKHFRSVTKGELELDAAEKETIEKEIAAAAETHKTLTGYLEKELAEQLASVRFTGRLTESACCLVGDEGAMSPHLERMFKAMNQEIPASKRVLELNPKHPLINVMQEMVDKDPESTRLKDYAHMLYDQALLTEGSPIPDPLQFARRVADLMAK